jgi:hypothetical protein
VVAGFTNSFSAKNELYLLKTDGNLSTVCNQANPSAIYGTPGLSIICKKINTGTIFNECEPQAVPFCQQWQNNLCYDPDGTTSGFCPVLSCPACIPLKPAPESGEEIASESTLASYPNPVTKGSQLKLGYTVEREGDLRVTLSDLTGRVVYEARGHYAAGTELAPIRTAGLATGTYIVAVDAGGKIVSGRVRVVER